MCNYISLRFDDGAGGDNEVQRTMLELINQLDGFDPRGNIKVFIWISSQGSDPRSPEAIYIKHLVTRQSAC